MGRVHVITAGIAIALGLVVLFRGRKGDRWHRAAGTLYLGAMLVVNLTALSTLDGSQRPGAFHALAVISIGTTGAGWLWLKMPGCRNRAIGAHASFMTWSCIGVVTAGLAQAAHRMWPHYSPWPVVLVIGVTTAAGLVCVPRVVSRQLRRQPAPATRL